LDKAIINGNPTSQFVRELNAAIGQYRKQANAICIDRGFCFDERDNFYNWLEKNKPELIKGEDVLLVDGQFSIDYPWLLPLNLIDMEQDEYNAFLDYIEEDLGDNLNRYSPMELSEAIYNFLIDYRDEDDIGDLYFFEHAWLDFDGLIIDFTWEQFKNAIQNTEDLYMRYHY